MITEYFAKFDEIINQADFIISSEVQKRKINSFLGIIEAKLVFESGLLEVLEVVKETDKLLKKKKYKYHYQRKNNSLFFRYDNAAHHFEIDTFLITNTYLIKLFQAKNLIYYKFFLKLKR